MNISDEDIDDIIICATALTVEIFKHFSRPPPSVRVNPYLKHRKTKGRFATDFADMTNNEEVFRENFHMKPSVFDYLLKLLEPKLKPAKTTRPDDEISPKEKLAIVLEYFASGSIQRHMASVYRISKQHLGKIVDDVCNAICSTLTAEIPTLNEAEFVKTANNFNSQWNFPNCLGAIDGKHVAIKCPRNAGSLFYNYKGFHSIVLMAIADANYKFTYLDVGAYGSEGDANVFATSEFGKATLQDKLPFPADVNVACEKLPYYFVADDAFPLNKRIMKPYAPRKPTKLQDDERIFNYRLSRARRCVENAFGILCSKWICLGRTMYCSPDRAQKIISACCYLHNFLLRTNKENYCPSKYSDYYDENGKLIEGEWRKAIPEKTLNSSKLKTSNIGRQNNCGKYTREKIKEYVNSAEGSLPWQRKAVFLE